MMRAWIAAGALALATAACVGPGAPSVTNAPQDGAPLEARLFPPYYGQVALQLSRPAYVALFEVVPGRGVSLIYPQSGTGFVPVRETWVPLHYSAQRWLYTARPGAAGRYDGGRYAGVRYGPTDPYDRYDMGAGGSYDAPRYLFVVASEEPLAVDRFQGDAASLRAFLGPARYDSYQPYEVMEQLAYALLPFDDAWVMDVYTDWGYDWGYGYGPGSSIAAASYYTVQCANGQFTSARWVTGWGWDGLPCPLANRPGAGRPGSPVIPPVGDDSTAAPVGGGRSRAEVPADTIGRRRAGEAAAERRSGEDAAEARSRQRIAELRDEARRAGFRDELSTRLRTQVGRRQMADAARGAARGTDDRRDERAAPGSRTRGSSEPAAAGRRRAAEPAGSTVRREAPASAKPSTGTSSRPSSAGSAPRSREPASRPPSSSSGSSGSSGSSEPKPASGGRTRTRPPA